MSAIRDALAELVAVDDLYHMAAPGVHKETWDARETAAWAAARAALAALPAVQEMCADGKTPRDAAWLPDFDKMMLRMFSGDYMPNMQFGFSGAELNQAGKLIRERLVHSGSAPTAEAASTATPEYGTRADMEQRADALRATVNKQAAMFDRCRNAEAAFLAAAAEARCPNEPTLLVPSELPETIGLWLDEAGNYYRLQPVALIPREPTEAMLAAAESLPGAKTINDVLAFHQIRTGATLPALEESFVVAAWRAMYDAWYAALPQGGKDD